MPLYPVLYLFYLYAPCRLLTSIRPRGRGKKYSAPDCRLSYSFDIDVVRNEVALSRGILVREQTQSDYSRDFVGPTAVCYIRWGNGETRQEEHSGRTMACDVACGHVHERHASGNEMTKRCKESSISLHCAGKVGKRSGSCWKVLFPTSCENLSNSWKIV